VTERRWSSALGFMRAWRLLGSLAALLPRPRILAAYAAVAAFGTAFFFFLHHLGNQIPYDLAKQRFIAAEHRGSSHVDPGNIFNGPYVYCEISLPILRMAERRTEGANSVLDAVALKTLGGSSGRPCSRLQAALSGVEQEEHAFKARYWWGARAVFAIALNHFSAKEVRELTEIGLYFAYALLAVSLLLLSPKTLLVVSPLVLYGAFFSGIRYFSDIVNGVPHLWTVLSAAVLAFLMRSRAPGSTAATGSVGVFCFFTGMASCFLWLGEGHAFVAIALIGMVAYFGGRHLGRRAAAGDAIACVSLYLAGFAACFWLGLIVKAALTEGVWEEFWSQVIYVFSTAEKKLPSLMDTWRQYLGLFYFMAMGKQYVLAGELLAFFSLFALAASTTFVVLQMFGRIGGEAAAAAGGGRRSSASSRFKPSLDILWILGLLLVNVPNFAVYDDVPARSASSLFVPFGLSASGLILVVLRMNGRGLIVLFGGLFSCTVIFLLYMKLDEHFLVKKIEGSEPIVRSAFDLYLFDDELVYVKDRCSDREIDRRFYLDVVPRRVDDLSGDHWRHGYEHMNFTFASRYYSYQHAIRSKQCILVHPLPDYDVSCIRAAKGFWRAEHCTDGFKRKQERVLRTIDESEPVINSRFEVYLIGGELIYVKDQCTATDRAAKFFLHVSPVDKAHLQEGSQDRKFDNLDFYFYPLFQDLDGPQRCIVARPLPNYDIASIWTGQFAGGKVLWDGEFRPRTE